MAVDPLDVYRKVITPGTTPADIDMMYGDTTPPAATPDQRLALDDDRAAIGAAFKDPSLTQPSPAPQVPDMAGSLSVPIAPPIAGGVDPLAKYASPDQRTVIASQGKQPTFDATQTPGLAAAINQAADAITKPPSPAPKESPGGVEVAPSTDQGRTDALARAMVEGELRGTPARRIPAHDQPISTTVVEHEKIPEELKEKIATDADARAGLAIDQGEEAAKAHEAAQKQAEEEAAATKRERAAVAARYQRQQEHLQEMDTSFKKLVDDTAIQPRDYWTSKDAGGKILAGISAIMFGIAGDPEGLQKQIDRDLADRRANRKEKLNAAQREIENFKSRMLSPEAAQSADRALAMQAASAEARRLAEAAAAPEARLKGMQVAQDLEAQAHLEMAKMAHEEAGARTTLIKHVPATVTGGGSLGDRVQLIAKKHGWTADKVLGLIANGKLPAPKEDRDAAVNAMSRLVVMPNGDKRYAGSEKEKEEVQKGINAASSLKTAYSNIEGILNKPGHSISREDVGQVRALVANNRQALRALGFSDKELSDLTGEGAGETWSSDTATKATITQMRSLLDSKINDQAKTLFTEPYSVEGTGGTTAKDVEVQ